MGQHASCTPCRAAGACGALPWRATPRRGAKSERTGAQRPWVDQIWSFCRRRRRPRRPHRLRRRPSWAWRPPHARRRGRAARALVYDKGRWSWDMRHNVHSALCLFVLQYTFGLRVTQPCACPQSTGGRADRRASSSAGTSRRSLTPSSVSACAAQCARHAPCQPERVKRPHRRPPARPPPGACRTRPCR